ENLMKSNIDKKFSAHYGAVEAELKSSTEAREAVREGVQEGGQVQVLLPVLHLGGRRGGGKEEEEVAMREEELERECEEIEITFIYWDGSGHWRTVKMKKDNTMQQFLQKTLEILRRDFSELRSAGVEQLIFYDFVVTKARGKSGPLFNFSVHDCSVMPLWRRMRYDSKVVLRSWCEKNKHIFPASCWEPYDPEKKWDKYT
ncbi:hypothetical protein U0070_020977, partial [Myodes glareolus]